MAAGAAGIFGIAPFEVEPCFLETFFVQVVKERRICRGTEPRGEFVQALKHRQEIRLWARGFHGTHHPIQLTEGGENFVFKVVHGDSIDARGAAANIAVRERASILAPMKIVVLDGHTLNPGDLSWEGLERLGECEIFARSTPGETAERLQNADAALTNKAPIQGDLLRQLPDLKYIGVTATGFNIVDVQTAKACEVTVTNVPAYGTDSVAQATFALLLELANRAGHHAQSVREGRWNRNPDFCYWDFPLVELAGLTLGIIGYGRIGRQVGRIAQAFGMKVFATQHRPRPVEGDVRIVPLEQLLRESDVITLHCPLTPETKGLINAERLGRMKHTAFLLNTSRGPLIVENDLAEALRAGRIAGAGLDVLTVEPPVERSPLFDAPNCYITPHQAWATRAARQRLMEVAVANLAAFTRGVAQNVVSG